MNYTALHGKRKYRAMKKKNDNNIIWHLDDLLREKLNLKAVVYMRASSWRQRQRKNLQNRQNALIEKLMEMGISIVEEFQEVASGRQLKDRPELKKAIMDARRFQAQNPDAIVELVSDTRNRFLRGENYNGQNSTDPPYDWQWDELKALAGDALLATLLPPDAPLKDVRAYETKIAGESGKQLGRPPKKEKSKPGVMKERRERLRPRAQKLLRRGKSKRGIARRLRVPLSTVWGWLKQP